MAEKVGFEPTWAKSPNGFQDRPVMTTSVPLRILIIGVSGGTRTHILSVNSRMLSLLATDTNLVAVVGLEPTYNNL